MAVKPHDKDCAHKRRATVFIFGLQPTGVRVEALASGDWLTSERRPHHCARSRWRPSRLADLAFRDWSSGTLDPLGRPLGTDFSNVWTAAGWRSTIARPPPGRGPSISRSRRALHRKRDVDLFGWHYPPPFLLVAAALATMPYVPALIVWQLATLIPFVAMM